MKLLITGDWHLTEKRPENRIDDYQAAMFNKLEFITRTAILHRCDYILQPGDLFDGPSPSYQFFGRVLNFLEHNNETPILTVYGQHDLEYRNLNNTAFKALTMSRPVIHTSKINTKGIVFHGAPFDGEIPTPEPGYFNVLIIHKMIVDDKLWAQQEQFEHSSHFIRQHKFDLIVSGDNHRSFINEVGNRRLFNCGSLMRSGIDQVDHKPFLVVFDTESRLWEKLEIPIESPSSVFKIEEVLEKKELDEKLKSFVDGLSEQNEVFLDFGRNLFSYCSENSVDEEVSNFIKECMA